MRRPALRSSPLALAVVIAAVASLFGAPARAQEPVCSAWLIESSRFMNVPFGSFMPDRAFVPGSTKPESNIPSVDLPVNIGVIKCGSELILYDTGWKQQDYLKMTNSVLAMSFRPLTSRCARYCATNFTIEPPNPRSSTEK